MDARTAPASGRVDSHTHLLPDRLAAAIRRFFEQAGPVPFAYPTDPAAVVARHADLGIDTLWTLPYAHTAGVAAQLNADVARLAAKTSTDEVTVVAGCTAHPDDADPTADVVAAVTLMGAKVIKLHCSVGGYDADDRRLADVYRRAGELRVPVVLHAGHAPTGRTAGEELAAVGRVAEAHPETVVIIAHTAHPATSAAVALLRRHPNLRADLTPVVTEHVDLRDEVLQELHGQLLLGTDAPNTCLPAEALLARLDRAGLTPDALAAITSSNARGLVTA